MLTSADFILASADILLASAEPDECAGASVYTGAVANAYAGAGAYAGGGRGAQWACGYIYICACMHVWWAGSLMGMYQRRRGVGAGTVLSPQPHAYRSEVERCLSLIVSEAVYSTAVMRGAST